MTLPTKPVSGNAPSAFDTYLTNVDETCADHEARIAAVEADDAGDDAALTAHIDDTTGAHAASAIANTPAGSIAATDVQAAIDELDTEKAAASALTAHIDDTSDAHDASAISFSPTGTIAGTDVQTAVAEVASEAASNLSTHEADTTSVHGITDTSTLYRSGGPDVAVADGGTGASDASGARTSLGLVIGTDVLPVASPTFTGVASGPVYAASGLTGAVAATRYVGGTASGAPASGTFAVGDFIIDQTGILWICTVAGSPGTWVDASSAGHELAYAEGATQQTGITTVTDVTSLTTGSFTVGSRPVEVEGFLPDVATASSASTGVLSLRDSGGTYTRKSRVGFDIANTARNMRVVERISTPGSYTRKLSLERTAGSGTLVINTNNDATTVGHIRVTVR